MSEKIQQSRRLGSGTELVASPPTHPESESDAKVFVKAPSALAAAAVCGADSTAMPSRAHISEMLRARRRALRFWQPTVHAATRPHWGARSIAIHVHSCRAQTRLASAPAALGEQRAQGTSWSGINSEEARRKHPARPRASARRTTMISSIAACHGSGLETLLGDSGAERMHEAVIELRAARSRAAPDQPGDRFSTSTVAQGGDDRLISVHRRRSGGGPCAPMTVSSDSRRPPRQRANNCAA